MPAIKKPVVPCFTNIEGCRCSGYEGASFGIFPSEAVKVIRLMYCPSMAQATRLGCYDLERIRKSIEMGKALNPVWQGRNPKQ